MSPLLQAGLNVTAIGMGVVIVLLTLLVGIIRGMSALCQLIEGPARGAADSTRASIASGGSASPTSQELVSIVGAAIVAHRKRHHPNR